MLFESYLCPVVDNYLNLKKKTGLLTVFCSTSFLMYGRKRPDEKTRLTFAFLIRAAATELPDESVIPVAIIHTSVVLPDFPLQNYSKLRSTIIRRSENSKTSCTRFMSTVFRGSTRTANPPRRRIGRPPAKRLR